MVALTHQRARNTRAATEKIAGIVALMLHRGTCSRRAMSSVVSRLMQLRVDAAFGRGCHKGFALIFAVENTAHKGCNLSHDDSSCTVAMKANLVILDAHFSPFVLPSRALQHPLQRFVVAVHRSDPAG
jgi:hypothetical protein